MLSVHSRGRGLKLTRSFHWSLHDTHHLCSVLGATHRALGLCPPGPHPPPCDVIRSLPGSAGFPGCSAQQTSKDGLEPAPGCNGDVVFTWTVSDHVLQAGIANKSQCSLEGNFASKQDTRKELNVPFPPPTLLFTACCHPPCRKRAKQ